MTRLLLRCLLPLLMLTGSVLGPARAAGEDQTYAVLSFIGRHLTIVTYQPSTGSLLDRNHRTQVPIDKPVFDHAALVAIRNTIRTAEPSARTVLLAAEDTATRAELDGWLSGDNFKGSEQIVQALRQTKATRLFLVTEHRGPTALQTSNAKIGEGYLDGLGYYVDRDTPLQRSDTGETGLGFLAPYVYIKVALVDLTSSKLMRQKVVMATTTLSAARNQGGADPWNALSSERKLTMLVEIVQQEAARVARELL